MEPPRLIFEQPPPRGRSHLALAGKIVAGTLAVSVLAAGGVEVFGGFSGHNSQDEQLGLSRAFAASAPAYAKLASVPNWLEAHTLAASKHQLAVKHTHAAKRHGKRQAAKPAASHAATHPSVTAHAPATSPAAQHAVLVAATTAHSTGGTTHAAAPTPHSTPSWSSHSSWHSTTSADGTTTKVTSSSHSTTVSGKTSTSSHTHTTVTPAASH